MSQQSSPGDLERKSVIARRVGGQYVALLFSFQLTFHTIIPFVTLSNKVRGIFFLRTVSTRPYCVEYVCACICVCIVG